MVSQPIKKCVFLQAVDTLFPLGLRYPCNRRRGQRIDRGMTDKVAITRDGGTIGGRPLRAAKFLGAEESLTFFEPAVSTPITIATYYAINKKICSRPARPASQFVSVFIDLFSTIIVLPVGTPTTSVASLRRFCHRSRETCMRAARTNGASTDG